MRILSLGRNVIKKLEQLEPVAATLEELWVSYNLLEKLVRAFELSHESCFAQLLLARP